MLSFCMHCSCKHYKICFGLTVESMVCYLPTERLDLSTDLWNNSFKEQSKQTQLWSTARLVEIWTNKNDVNASSVELSWAMPCVWRGGCVVMRVMGRWRLWPADTLERPFNLKRRSWWITWGKCLPEPYLKQSVHFRHWAWSISISLLSPLTLPQPFHQTWLIVLVMW